MCKYVCVSDNNDKQPADQHHHHHKPASLNVIWFVIKILACSFLCLFHFTNKEFMQSILSRISGMIIALLPALLRHHPFIGIGDVVIQLVGSF